MKKFLQENRILLSIGLMIIGFYLFYISFVDAYHNGSSGTNQMELLEACMAFAIIWGMTTLKD